MGTPGRNKTEPERVATRLYLVVSSSGDVAALAAALGASDVAAVLLRPASQDERALIDVVKTLASVVQGNGAALLLADRAALVARSGADGAHLSGIDAFTDNAAGLKPERIAGCGGLATRHDAMLAAEAGADYVMFGEPDGDGRRPAFDAVLDRVAWWADVFQIPCVGFAASLAEVEELVRAGADFVAIDDVLWRDTAVLGKIVQALGVAEPVP